MAVLRDACIAISIRSLFAVVPDICGPFHQLVWSSLCSTECGFAGNFRVSVLDCSLFRPFVKVYAVSFQKRIRTFGHRDMLKRRFLVLKREEI